MSEVKEKLVKIEELKNQVFSDNQSDDAKSEARDADHEINSIYADLIFDEEGSIENYLVEYCNYLYEYMLSGQERHNHEYHFTECLTRINNEYASMKLPNESAYFELIIKYNIDKYFLQRIANDHFNRENYQRAIEYYSVFLKMDTSNESVWMNNIKAYQKEYTESIAKEMFEAALQHLPESALIRNNYGHQYFDKQQFDEALEEFQEVLRQRQSHKFQTRHYFKYAAEMIDKIYIEKEKIIERIFNYDALLSGNLYEDEIPKLVEDIIETSQKASVENCDE